MPSIISLLEPAMVDDTTTLYLSCRPLSESPPEDLPQVQSLANSYWSARIITKPHNMGEPVSLSGWFSLPYSNIHKALWSHPDGAVIIKLDSLGEDQQETLFTDSKPVFKVDSTLKSESARWIHRLNEHRDSEE